MSFLKEIFNSIARTLGRILAYIIIGFIIFFVFSKFSNAQDLYWNRPRVNAITNYVDPSSTSVIESYDNKVVGTLNSFNTNGNRLSPRFRINQNIVDTNISNLPIDTHYKIVLKGTFQVINSKSPNLSSAIRVFSSSQSSYLSATCDGSSSVEISKFSDSSNRYNYTYTCTDFIVDRNDITFLAIIIYSSNVNFNYNYISSLSLYDITNEKDNDSIINNQDKNTQEIIDNQDKNQQETNDRLDNINDSLTDSSVPSVDNVPTFDFNDGPISGILTMPITWFNAFVNPSVCQPISIGKLLGTELKFECIDPVKYLGSSLWNTIDIFIVVMMIISIGSMILHIVDSFRNLNDMYDEYYTPQHAGYKTKHNGERV